MVHMKALFRIILLVILLVMLLGGFTFVRSNIDPVGLWLGVEFEPRAVGQWFMIFFVAGGVFGLVAGLGLYRHFRNRFKIRQLQSRIQKLDDENRKLRQQLPHAIVVDK